MALFDSIPIPDLCYRLLSLTPDLFTQATVHDFVKPFVLGYTTITLTSLEGHYHTRVDQYRLSQLLRLMAKDTGKRPPLIVVPSLGTTPFRVSAEPTNHLVADVIGTKLTLLDGAHRAAAATEKGIKEWPCIVINPVLTSSDNHMFAALSLASVHVDKDSIPNHPAENPTKSCLILMAKIRAMYGPHPFPILELIQQNLGSKSILPLFNELDNVLPLWGLIESLGNEWDKDTPNHLPLMMLTQQYKVQLPVVLRMLVQFMVSHSADGNPWHILRAIYGDISNVILYLTPRVVVEMHEQAVRLNNPGTPKTAKVQLVKAMIAPKAHWPKVIALLDMFPTVYPMGAKHPFELPKPPSHTSKFLMSFPMSASTPPPSAYSEPSSDLSMMFQVPSPVSTLPDSTGPLPLDEVPSMDSLFESNMSSPPTPNESYTASIRPNRDFSPTIKNLVTGSSLFKGGS